MQDFLDFKNVLGVAISVKQIQTTSHIKRHKISIENLRMETRVFSPPPSIKPGKPQSTRVHDRVAHRRTSMLILSTGP